MRKSAAAIFLVTWLSVLPLNICRGQTASKELGKKAVEAKKMIRADHDGAPLPRNARERLGTLRFRHGAAIYSVSFSADGKKLAATDGYGNCVLWEAATGKKLDQIKGGPYAFFPDGKILHLGGGSRQISLLDVATGKVLGEFHDQEEGLRRVLFSPDRRTVASVVDGKPIRLWDVATGKELRQLQGHRDRVCNIAFSHDGKTLAVADSSDTIRLWEVARGKVECPPFVGPGKMTVHRTTDLI